MDSDFQTDRVTLVLSPREYSFVYLTMSYVLHGTRLEDHDFKNILSMSRANAEVLMESISAAENTARSEGSHWMGLAPEE